MRLGVGAVAKDPDALLMFSGGATRAPAGPRTEAASYWGVIDAAGWFGEPAVRRRTVLEVRTQAKPSGVTSIASSAFSGSCGEVHQACCWMESLRRSQLQSGLNGSL